MPGDAIIGKVAVKVIPDTKLFKDELEAQLTKIESTLDDVGVQIRPILDGTTIKAEAKALKAQLEKDIGTISVQFDPDNQATISREIDKIQRHIDRLNETEIIPNIGLNMADLAAARELLHEELAKVAHIDLYIDDADPNSVKAAIAKIDAELQKMQPTVEVKLSEEDLLAKRAELAAIIEEMNSTVKIQVDMADSNDVKSALSSLKKELHKITSPTIKVKLDEASLTAEIAKLEAELEAAAHLDIRVDESDLKNVKKAIDKIDAELENLSAPISIHLDEASLKAERQRLQQIINDQIAQEEFQARVEMTLDQAAATKTLDDIQRKINAITTVNVKTQVDTVKLEKTKREIMDTFLSLDELDKKIAVELDPIKRQKLEHEIRDLEDKLSNLKANIKAQVSEPEKLAVTARLALLARDRIVKIVPEVSKTAAAKAGAVLAGLSGFNLAKEGLEGLDHLFTNLDTIALKFATVGMSIGAVGAAALSSVSNILSLGASLASIAPAALALPGILGGIAVGVGVAAIALADFKKYVPEITSLWQTMRTTISNNFWKVAAKPIRDMVDTLLPQFTKEMGGTATILGGFFGNLATQIKNAFGPRISNMFKNLNDSIVIATGSTGSYANIIATLGDIGASYLPRLATFFADISDKFSAFLTQAENDGRLKGWIDTGISALKDLGNVVSGVADIFGGLASAASEAASSTLETLGSALHDIADTINSEPFHSKLVKVFDAAHDAIDNLITQAGPGLKNFFSSFADTVSSLLPMIGETIGTLVGDIADALARPEIQKGISNLFEGVRNVVNDMHDVWPQVSDALGALGTTIGTVLTQLGPGFSQAIGVIAQAVTDISPSLDQLATKLGPGLSDAITTLQPMVALAVQFLGGLLTMLEEMGTEIGNIALFLTGQWDDLDGKFSAHMLTRNATQNYWTTKNSDDLKTAVATDEDTLGNHWHTIDKTNGDGFNAWNEMAKESYGEHEKIAGAGHQAIQAQAIQNNTVFQNIMAGNWSTVKQQVRDAWTSMTQTIAEKLGDIGGEMHSLRATILGAVGDIGTWLLQAGKDLIQGLIDGLKQKANDAQGVVKGIGMGLIATMKGVLDINSPSRVFRAIGEGTMEGYQQGLENKYGDVKDSLYGFASDLTGTDIPINPNMTASLSAQVQASGGSAAQPITRVLNYYAAENSSLSSDEELFTAAGRSRMGAW